MFAVIDLETTGGNHNSERIIEIGIVLHNGNQKTGEYTTLINPDKEISVFISTFTGITNSMVRNAPRFSDVAPTLLELLEDKIIVAHNARFDYNFIKSEFRRLNIPFVKNNICTVQLSRKIFPQFKSHSLGNICRDLGITVDNRHRAFGDAAATALLLEKIIQQDTNNLLQELIQNKQEHIHLPKNIPTKRIEVLPEEVGVLYLYNKEGEVIYIDKSKNIRDYFFSFFDKKPIERFKQALLDEVFDVSFDLSGNELIASVMELDAIKQLSPKYNRPVANPFYRYGLFSELDANGFQKLVVKILEEEDNPLIKFSSKFKADRMLKGILANFTLEPTFKKIDSAFQYNKRIQDALSKYLYPYQNFFIIDMGRGGSEKSVLCIEDGVYKGYGFYEPTYVSDVSQLKDGIKIIEKPIEAQKLILQYIRKNAKHIELIPF